MGIFAILFLSSPLWLGFLGYRARSRVARGLLWGLGAATVLTFGLMLFLGASCRAAQDLTYFPELCPGLPGAFVTLATPLMIAGILLLPFLNVLGLPVAAIFELLARRAAKTSPEDRKGLDRQ